MAGPLSLCQGLGDWDSVLSFCSPRNNTLPRSALLRSHERILSRGGSVLFAGNTHRVGRGIMGDGFDSVEAWRRSPGLRTMLFMIRERWNVRRRERIGSARIGNRGAGMALHASPDTFKIVSSGARFVRFIDLPKFVARDHDQSAFRAQTRQESDFVIKKRSRQRRNDQRLAAIVKSPLSRAKRAIWKMLLPSSSSFSAGSGRSRIIWSIYGQNSIPYGEPSCSKNREC